MATAIADAELAQAVFPFDITVDIYSEMLEMGLIPDKRRIFLMDGRLFEKMAKSKAHCYVGAAINRTLSRRLPECWTLWPKSTIVLDQRNAPLPDFAVVRGANPLDYASPARFPVPTDIGILIEIAVSSLRHNLTTTLEHYARRLIPVYWVIDVTGLRIIVHSEPRIVEGRGEYARVETYQPGQLVPLVLDGQETTKVPFEEFLR